MASCYSFEIILYTVHAYPVAPDLCAGANSIPDSEANNPGTDIPSTFDENDIETEHFLGPYPFEEAPRKAMLSFFKGRGGESGQPAQRLDLVEKFGIVAILPSAFDRPGLDTRPYDTSDSDNRKDTFFILFALEAEIDRGLASKAFAIELLDPEKFSANIDDGLQFLEEIYGRLYG